MYFYVINYTNYFLLEYNIENQLKLTKIYDFPQFYINY
jgi:hypothetical protein